MRTKKAQMEILGLAIVVLLLILGMVFVIRFLGTSDNGSIRKEVSESQIASNYISTYLDTTIPTCKGLTIEELLIDCAESAAPSTGTIDCDNPTGYKSCEMAREVAKEIFSKTFDQWKTRYYFSVFVKSAGSTGNPNPFIELSYPQDNPATPAVETLTKCTGTKRSKDYPLSTDAGTLHVKLDLCTSK